MHAKQFSVLVTRPDGLAKPLITALENIGATVYHYPTLKIKWLPNEKQVQDAIQHLTNYHWHIFVSKNAVAAVIPEIINTWPIQELEKLNFAAVGPGTAKELENLINKIQIKHTQNPTKFNPNGWPKSSLFSRAAREHEKGSRGQAPFGCEPSVLRIPIIYPNQDKGAKALRKELEHKIKKDDTVLEWCGDNPTPVWPGAKQVMCYQREKNPQYFEMPGTVDYIVVTSGTSMECLEINQCHHSKLVVISERLMNLAKKSGFTGKIILAKGADDESIMNAIKGDLNEKN
ncbi:MAG: uroporphyrinogen-III synthase [Gammaproteobacteria bacterium]